MNASDGGLDVRVALPAGTAIAGFVPRAATGFQVKAQDMPPNEIVHEMAPNDILRETIKDLAAVGGAYVIVSSKGSTADSALKRRIKAVREALGDSPDGAQLHIDFYDRNRIATWVRQHAGLILWTRTQVGRSLIGWQPYGSWVGAAEMAQGEYLVDETLRLHLGFRRDSPALPVAAAIDEIRDELARPGSVVRLVGLSGVGKTRLAQALFDPKVGARPLMASQAVYANVSDNPNPQPTGLASDVLANKKRAILIVDNCPPDLHRRLAELCSGDASSISVLTVEYDVRDDQPERTLVVRLDTSSEALIEKLIGQRYPHISQVDVRTIARASGGNARIAIAIADTVRRSDTVAGLSNEELFQRLFRQRHDSSSSLLLAAQACSLVYSFQGEDLTSAEADLPHLAALAGQSIGETYRHVGELLRRGLAQKRGPWRAVLPHAIANTLAARALEEIPMGVINEQIVQKGTPHLVKSFSRRLSYLHEHPKAVEIARDWLSPNGLLGHGNLLDEFYQAIFENIAPVAPEATLSALERLISNSRFGDGVPLERHIYVLRSLAYDAAYFERCARLLKAIATQIEDGEIAKIASEVHSSLFTILLSGTHAPIEQRLGVIETLLKDVNERTRSLGLAALESALEATHFTSANNFQFGARSRDFGYSPKCDADMSRWYSAALALVERLVVDGGVPVEELRKVVAHKFRGLWSSSRAYGPMAALCRRLARNCFWRDGWLACRETMKYDGSRLTPLAMSHLSSLVHDLAPSNLRDRVAAIVLSTRALEFDLENLDPEDDAGEAADRLDAHAVELGKEVALSNDLLESLVPELLRGGSRTWQFGRGLASASPDPYETWALLARGMEQQPHGIGDLRVVKGFVAGLWERDSDLAQSILDSALTNEFLVSVFPILQIAVDIDARGAERLKFALNDNRVPTWAFSNLAFGGVSANIESTVLSDLLAAIARRSDGVRVAIEILYMRFLADNSAKQPHAQELLRVGKELMRLATFRRNDHRGDHELSGIAKLTLVGPDSGPIAAEIALRIRQAATKYETSIFDYDDLLRALLQVQPEAVLDALFAAGARNHARTIQMFDIALNRANPIDSIGIETLVAWCDKEPEKRYAQMASIISIARRPDAVGPIVWSDQAKVLLQRAPDARKVFTTLIRRLRPVSWSGSYAVALEANAKLLDQLGTLQTVLLDLVISAKAELAQEVASAREYETRLDRDRDEQFE